MKLKHVAATGIIILVGAAVLVAFATSGTKESPTVGNLTSTTTTVTASSQTAVPCQPMTTAPSNNGLEFTMTLNSSSVVQGGAIAVQMNLYNMLDKPNYVCAANDWLVTNQSEVWHGIDCSFGLRPFRIAVLSGFYDSHNYSSGAPVSIFPFPSGGSFNYCLFYMPSLVLDSHYYLFEPHSDIANLTSQSQPTMINITVTIDPLTFTLPTGQYTIVGGDEWGDLVIAHFVVEVSPS